MRLTSSIPGELIPAPSSGSIPELPHVAKLGYFLRLGRIGRPTETVMTRYHS
jgi:hypothetical protein